MIDFYLSGEAQTDDLKAQYSGIRCSTLVYLVLPQCIIFCHTRKTASWLAGKLSEEGHRVAMLSGELTIEQRAAVINRFRLGNEKILITTNVSARGIDVAQVYTDLVMMLWENYELLWLVVFWCFLCLPRLTRPYFLFLILGYGSYQLRPPDRSRDQRARL